jgi:hypothetical protein
MANVTKVFHYFNSFPGDEVIVGLRGGCNLCSVKMGACLVSLEYCSLVLQSGIPTVFRNKLIWLIHLST